MLTKTVLGVGVYSYAIFGAMCVVWQATYVGGDMGYALSSSNARIEAYSMYGGLQIGLGLFFTLAFFRPEFRRAALVVLIFVPGGWALRGASHVDHGR